MTLTYCFDEYSEYEHEYEIDADQIKDYFKSLTRKEQLEAIKGEWDKMSDEEKSEMLDLIDDPTLIKEVDGNKVPDFETIYEDDFDWLVDTFIVDSIEYGESAEDWEDELKDYFKDEAREDYGEYQDWKKDPYGGEWHHLSYYR